MILKKFLNLGLLTASLLITMVAQAQQGPAPQGPRVVSPEILSNKQVTFRLLAPKAEKSCSEWKLGQRDKSTNDEG